MITLSRASASTVTPADPPLSSPLEVNRAWWLLGVIAVLTIAGATGVGGDYAFSVAVLAGLSAAVYGLTRQRLDPLWPWVGLVAAGLLWALASALTEVYETTGDLSDQRSLLPDLLAIPAYLGFGMALFGLTRSHVHVDRHETTLDALIVGGASFIVIYEFVIAPTIGLADTWVGARLVVSAYPTLAMVLVAFSVRLAFAHGQRSTSFNLLFVGTLGLLIGDVMFALGETGRLDIPSRWFEIPYFIAPACIGAALVHPSAATVLRPRPAPASPLLRRRLVPVLAGLCTPSAVMLVHRSSPVPIVVTVVAALLMVAAIVRVAGAIRKQASMTTELSYRATHDDLTALPSRSLLSVELSRMLDEHDQVAVLFIDLDHFKFVNDSMGHAVGDQLLIEVARRLTHVAPPHAAVARQSGDEFIVAAPGLNVQQAFALAELLRRRLGEQYVLPGGETAIAVSIGIGHTAGRDDVTAADLLREADTAMYRSKESGRDAVTMFDTSMHERMLRRVELERSLRQAVDAGQIEVAYQPIVDHRSGTIEGFEALARWTRDGQPVSPVEFVPIAEDSGLIVPLGEQILDAACRNVAWWRSHIPGAQHTYVSVNVSPRQLRSSDFVDVVADMLRTHDLPGEALWLEITERVVMDDSVTVLALMTGLRSLGVRLAIDDFGTGYSSLSYLKRFPLSRVKIDKSFVAGIGSNEADTSLVHAIVAMASALQLHPVAEGVEYLYQADHLMALGCESMQGYHFGRPMPADAVVDMLRARSPRHALTVPMTGRRCVTPTRR